MQKSRYLFIIILITVTFGCGSSSEIERLPECIQNIIEEDRDSDYSIIKVSEQIVDNETFYLLEDNLVFSGEANYIYNNNCDSTCYYCSDCILPECADIFKREEWEVIWEE